MPWVEVTIVSQSVCLFVHQLFTTLAAITFESFSASSFLLSTLPYLLPPSVTLTPPGPPLPHLSSPFLSPYIIIIMHLYLSAENKAIGVMKPGQTFTIEPMINAGTWRDVTWPDDWTSTTTVSHSGAAAGKCSGFFCFCFLSY